MNKSFRKPLLFAALCLTLPGLAFGRGKLKPREPFKPPYDVISAVDASAQTVTIGHVNSTNNTSKTYKVDKLTEIQVNGQKGTFTNIQTGMKVSVTPGFDETVASRLVLSPPPPEPKAN